MKPGFAPEGKQLVQILISLTEDAYDDWKERYEADPEGYRKKKEDLAGKAMALVEERFPLYAGKMTLLDAWTPITYNHILGAYRGDTRAFIVSKKASRNPYPPATIREVDNVVLASQWLRPPGGLDSAAIVGKFAVMRVMNLEGVLAKKDELAEKNKGKKKSLFFPT
jgi:phytoene dehydrogenase-like protein